MAAACLHDPSAPLDPEVVRALAEVADDVARLRGAIAALRADEAARAARRGALTLHGPQKAGAGSSQDEIDALFG